ncbi:ABC transporter permease [Pelagicoccus mobilis]|uniref:ABC transporter permease n=1 Tax=Pelagicoccus mobilis TaxID=415221 RepID=A0A934RZ63_9BACT|nr:ABC transporter permease [Pelagicoccus mobilis]MBK1877561.1 ABC transporter permease [Pelagicoccus mobilis]
MYSKTGYDKVMSFFTNIRFAFRLLAKNPGSTIMAIVVMATGTGVAITMFAFVNGVLWSSPDFAKKGTIYNIDWVERDKYKNSQRVSPLDYEIFESESEQIDEMTAYMGWRAPVYNPSSDAFAKEYNYKRVSVNFFEFLGEKMHLGRSFLPEDVSREKDDTVVISHALWREQYGSNEEAVGSTLMVGGLPHKVVGVARPGFRFPDDNNLWKASDWPEPRMSTSPSGTGRRHWVKVYMLARLKEGVTPRQAEAELATIAEGIANEYPESNDNLLRMNVEPFTEWYIRDEVENRAYGLFLCSFLVLAVACANTFNLIMSRTASRTSELSIRSALGANRAHIVGQVVLDGLVLTSIGALGGVLIAGWSLKFIWSFFKSGYSDAYWWHMNLDAKVMGFVVGLVFVSSVVSSLVPGLRAARSATAENLKDDARTSSGLFVGSLSRLILGFQISASSVLAFVSILMLAVWYKSNTRPWPIEPTEILSTGFNLAGLGEDEHDPILVEAPRAMKERLEAYPGVDSVSFTIKAVCGIYGGTFLPFEMEGEDYENSRQKPKARVMGIDLGYEDVFDAKLLAGRMFNSLDTKETEAVCIVSKRFVDYYWPGEDPIGKRIRFNDIHWIRDGFLTVVGVMPKLTRAPLGKESSDLSNIGDIKIYTPLAQGTHAELGMQLRSKGDPRRWIPTIRRELAKIGPQYTLITNTVTVMEDEYRFLAKENLTLTMFGLFGAASLVLGAVGLYSIMSFDTGRRFREFGIRMALGADSKNVVYAVIRNGIATLAIGSSFGLVLGHTLTVLMQESLEINVMPLGFVYPVVVVLLITSMGVAMGVPAWKASRTPPSQALRVN